MAAITGIRVELLQREQTGMNEFGEPFFTETAVPVENVLVYPASSEEITETLNLTGRRAVYQLAIPKADTHNWENQRVRFFNEVWQVIGKPVRGINHLMPLDWNMKVKVESMNGK